MGIAAAYLLSSGVSVTYGFIFAPSLFAGLVAAVAPPAALPFVAAVLARSLSVFAAALAYLAAAAGIGKSPAGHLPETAGLNLETIEYQKYKLGCVAGFGLRPPISFTAVASACDGLLPSKN